MLEIDLITLEERQHRWYEASGAVDAERMGALATESADEVEHLVAAELRASVRRRLLSDVPVGTMLSGGLDSSLITTLAAEANPGVHAYTASIADQPGADASDYGRRVAEHLGIPFHVIPMNGAAWRRDLVDPVRHLEAPGAP